MGEIREAMSVKGIQHTGMSYYYMMSDRQWVPRGGELNRPIGGPVVGI